MDEELAKPETSSKTCPACTCENGMLALVCQACGSLLPDLNNQGQLWICDKCTYHNKLTDEKCQLCQAAKNSVSEGRPTIATSGSQCTSNTRPVIKRQVSALSQKRRSEDVAVTNHRVQQIKSFCKESKTLFEDNDFPPTASSLVLPSDNDIRFSGRSRIANWHRPSQISSPDRRLPWALFRDPKSTDIVQGLLANCWFASALSVLAERPQLLEKIFITKEYNASGVYAMRLCKDGQWLVVVVDDRLPCLDNGTLAFCRANRNQLWASLLEKAMAKLHGSYSSLISGTAKEGLAILTGFSCICIELSSSRGTRDLDKDFLWAQLLSSSDSKFLMGCSCGNTGYSADEYKSVGLVANHAYSILDVQLVNGERLVRLRNTWGEFSWLGDWSELSDKWDAVPVDVKQGLAFKGFHQGLFWISLDDWLKYFSAVYICYVREGWHEARIDSLFQTGGDEVLSMSRLNVPERTEIDISLHQKSTRGATDHDLVDILFVVYDDNWNLICHSKRTLQNHTNCCTVLEAGYYNVHCVSFARWSDSNVHYTLACHSHKPVQLELITLPAGRLSEVIINLAIKKGEQSLCDNTGKMMIYSLTNGWCGHIAVAVNDDYSNFLHICSDLTNSSNLLVTRELQTIDSIPPRHRQVINVTTHFESSMGFAIRNKQSYVRSPFPLPSQWGCSIPHHPPINANVSSLHKPVEAHRL